MVYPGIVIKGMISMTIAVFVSLVVLPVMARLATDDSWSSTSQTALDRRDDVMVVYQVFPIILALGYVVWMIFATVRRERQENVYDDSGWL